jgi:hypothetical protein
MHTILHGWISTGPMPAPGKAQCGAAWASHARASPQRWQGSLSGLWRSGEGPGASPKPRRFRPGYAPQALPYRPHRGPCEGRQVNAE